MKYAVRQHGWGFEVYSLERERTEATFLRDRHKSFSECRTLAEDLCRRLNGETR